MESEMHINYEQLADVDNFSKEKFLPARPYSHLIIDNFLNEDSYRSVLKSIPSPRLNEKSSDYIFAKNKFENPIFEGSSSTLSELRSELIGDNFVEFLTRIYGKQVFIDENFVGGGLHQGGTGSYLEMHADFSRHPVHREWVRELNVLLYLNDGFEESWGGHLEMHNSTTGEKGRIAPIGNRMVIMLTKDHTLHGYKSISFPEGKYRTSIASYAYTKDLDFESTPERSTLWVPDDSGLTKKIIAKISPTLVKVKRGIFGSSTAKRANRDSRK
jgi:hypothetical protein